MHVCNKKYLTKDIYVCLGSKIPWICVYIAKILTQKMDTTLKLKIDKKTKTIRKYNHRNEKKQFWDNLLWNLTHLMRPSN